MGRFFTLALGAVLLGGFVALALAAGAALAYADTPPGTTAAGIRAVVDCGTLRGAGSVEFIAPWATYEVKFSCPAPLPI